MRRINEAGLRLIKQFEGLELTAYQDSAGVWTIGYGHTSRAGAPAVTADLTITEAEAEKILMRDLNVFETQVERLLKVPIGDNEFAALVSLCFNIGADAFAGSTCLQRLNKGDRSGAAEALTWWNKATVKGKKTTLAGLVRRRTAERALFEADGGANLKAAAVQVQTALNDLGAGLLVDGDLGPVTKAAVKTASKAVSQAAATKVKVVAGGAGLVGVIALGQALYGLYAEHADALGLMVSLLWSKAAWAQALEAGSLPQIIAGAATFAAGATGLIVNWWKRKG